MDDLIYTAKLESEQLMENEKYALLVSGDEVKE